MPSRETYNIIKRIKYSKTIKDKISITYTIFKFFIIDKYYRKLIIKDNISTPIHKLIICKIKNHTYIKSDENYWWCTKCNHIIYDKDYQQYIRKIKILKIKKKC